MKPLCIDIFKSPTGFLGTSIALRYQEESTMHNLWNLSLHIYNYH